MQPQINQLALGQKKSKKKLLIIISIIFAGLLLIGAATTFLIVNSIRNKPENVLAQSIYNQVFEPESPAKIKGQIKYDVYDPAVPFREMTLDFNGLASDKKVQLDLDLGASIFRIRGSVFIDSDTGSLYIKAEDLQDLLASELAEDYGIPAEIRSEIQGLSGKWIEITPSDITELSGGNASGDDYGKCIDSISSLLSNQIFKDAFKQSYKDNKFVTIKNSSTEIVDGQKLLKVEASFDSTLAESFGKQFEAGAPDIVKEATKGCDFLSDATDSVNDDASSVEGEFKNPTVTIWINRSAKQIRKITMTADFMEHNKHVYSVTIDMQINPTQEVPEAPTNTVNIKKVLELFGADTSRPQNLEPISL